MKQQIRRIIGTYGKLSVPISSVRDNDDLFAAGMDSLAVVDILVAVEDEFCLELPDRLLSRETFASIDALAAAVDVLVPA